MLFIVGLWPFNFTEKNEARINPEEGLIIAKPGTVYAAVPSEKLHNLARFTIFIDLTTASNGLSAFERIFSYANNHRDLNFIAGQWKDGLSFHLPDVKRGRVIHFGAEGLLEQDKRTTLLVSYDGIKLALLQDGRARIYRETGPLSFSNWSREYPLVIGTDADGKAQWKGTIYEIAVFDRAVTPGEVQGFKGSGVQVERADSRQPTADSRRKRSQQQQTKKQENPPLSPFTKGGGHEKSQNNRPLVHYVFKPENTYETEFRGRKALGVRDLGKGAAADLVIPEYFEPYERAFLGWETDWAKNRTNLLDTVVNIIGFIPLGILLIFAAGKKKCLSVLVPECLSEEKEEGFGISEEKAIKKENPPQSPFTKGGGFGGDPFTKGGELEGGPFAKGGGLVVAVILAVVVGFGVSFAIEYLQAYLPYRDSSLRDLFANTLGTALGAAAAAWYSRKGFGLRDKRWASGFRLPESG